MSSKSSEQRLATIVVRGRHSFMTH
jgi:hypothetical protein